MSACNAVDNFLSMCCQINCVVMKGLNDDEICDFVALTENKVRV